jgi:hypothetical protein
LPFVSLYNVIKLPLLTKVDTSKVGIGVGGVGTGGKIIYSNYSIH